jgi:Na+/proline symporter
MSTISSNLNSAATAITVDFWERLVLRRRKMDAKDGDRSKLRCAQTATFIVGILGGVFALALANADIGNIYDQFQRFLGILTGGLGCLFLMGVFMRRINGFGAMCGLIVNYVVCFSLDAVEWSGKPHMLLLGFLGMVACLVVAPIASLKGFKK